MQFEWRHCKRGERESGCRVHLYDTEKRQTKLKTSLTLLWPHWHCKLVWKFDPWCNQLCPDFIAGKYSSFTEDRDTIALFIGDRVKAHCYLVLIHLHDHICTYIATSSNNKRLQNFLVTRTFVNCVQNCKNNNLFIHWSPATYERRFGLPLQRCSAAKVHTKIGIQTHMLKFIVMYMCTTY